MEGRVVDLDVKKEEEEDEQVMTMAALPPGFRFHPTDEEIITYYLREKVMNTKFTATPIAHVDLNNCEPWDLPKKAKMGEKEWYFFCERDRKYPTGMRTNRATQSGYWKATGKDKEIFNKPKNKIVGMRKTLVFYIGRAPKGEKSNWVMHEYRLEAKLSFYNLFNNKPTRKDWVVCKVFHKNNTTVAGSITTIPVMSSSQQVAKVDSFPQGHLLEILSSSSSSRPSLPSPLEHLPHPDHTTHPQHSTSFTTTTTATNNSMQMPQKQKGFLAPPTHNNYYYQSSTPTSTFGAADHQVARPQDAKFNQQYSPSSFISYQHLHPHLHPQSNNNSMVTVSQDTATGHSTDMGPPEISSSLMMIHTNNTLQNGGDDTSFDHFFDSFWDV